MEIAMKTTLFALLFLCATTAFGQAGGSVISNEPQPLQIQSHQQHASPSFLQCEQTLLIASGSTYGRGERPLWEFAGKAIAEISLGDAARLLRNEHALAKKAVKVLNK